MKILLVRLRLIGDVVFTTPALRALRRHAPTAHLTYVVEPEAAAVVADNPHLDRVIVAERRRGAARVAYDLALVRDLRAERFDVAIDFHGGARSSLLTFASGARTRIGYAIPGRVWAYTRLIPRPRALRARHSVENQWDLLAPFGGALARPPAPAADAVEMAENSEAIRRVTARLNGTLPAGTRLIVIHVSAGNAFRRWPAAAFVELVHRLIETSRDRRIALTAGPSDHDAVRHIVSEVGVRTQRPVEDWLVDIADVDLAELRAVIDRAALFIGGDSGPLHIAATTWVPIVGVFGPTLAARSAPWRDPRIPTTSLEVADLACRPCDQRRCAPGDFRCLTRIDPVHVAEAAERLLAVPSRDLTRGAAV